MLIYQYNRPEETLVINEPGPCSWYALVVDETDETYGWIGICLDNDQAGLHSVFRRSIVGIQKQVKKDFARIIESLQSRGVKGVIASNPDIKDERWPKFIQWLGFPAPSLIYVSVMEI